MKLACASSALGREIESGELTQLEFLDLCARDFACDGVVLDARHFPRTDGDYLAQVKKMATDWGLTIAALSDPNFFKFDAERMKEILEYAVALGTPLVAAPLCGETECSWSEQLARLGSATSLAKRVNVTLALRNAPATFAGSAHDCKRVAKESDSAWLRFGPDPAALDGASDPRSLAPNTVLLWSRVASTPENVAGAIEAFANFRGFVAIDDTSENASAELLAECVADWRAALCRAAQKELNRR
ncbi:MAG TPA: hypothetical protein VGI19_07955 [Candidatus Cybelea sp.]|jgi:hypothetical protein